MSAQKLTSFKIFSKSGKSVKYKKMIKSLNDAEVIFFGELHNNPICHWLEMEVVKSMDASHNIAVGMEMFETDTQKDLDSYLNDEMESKEFLEKCRAWNNYKTDYAQIVEYAKTKKFPVIASNVPRRYANMVYKEGFEVIESLVVDEKQWMAPLPIPYDASLPGYVKMLEMVGGHGGDNFPKAQAIKDATMAHSILKYLPDNGKMVHLNGAYHSNDFEGILWYINQYQPDVTMQTITSVVQSDINELEEESLGKADFIIVIDEDVTTSY
ncbi:MAG: ChaN family lipoprotein [Bacteroidia bacterium]|nr:ChaN family lipoprotein [Bacteroidia bacterium]